MIERQGDWWFEAKSISDSSRKFDIAFWQDQGPEAIFKAAWELVKQAAAVKGIPEDELRLSRSHFVVREIGR
jgi:hypothetical protein